MGKRKLIIIISSVIFVTIISCLVLTTISRADDNNQSINDTNSYKPASSDKKSDDYTYIPPKKESKDNENAEDTSEEPFVPAKKIDLDLSSITLYVNKEYSLPKDYIPSDLVELNVPFHNIPGHDERKMMRKEAAAALEDLFNAAAEDGIYLYGVSGYRSYNRQYKIFTNDLVKYGKDHTLKYSAIPGTSEHQTGLSIDVSCASFGYKLEDTFGDTTEGKWLAENSYRYGFIIRYPEDKVDITGYAYEPWHVRYVGKPLAKYLNAKNLTLDEYYHYTPSKGFDYNTLYAEILNYKPPVYIPKVTVTPTVSVAASDKEEDSKDADGKDDTKLTVTPTPPASKDNTPTKGAAKPTVAPTPTPKPKPTTAPSVDVTPTPAVDNSSSAE